MFVPSLLLDLLPGAGFAPHAAPAPFKAGSPEPAVWAEIPSQLCGSCEPARLQLELLEWMLLFALAPASERVCSELSPPNRGTGTSK